MKEGDKAKVTNQFHAWRGRVGIITSIGKDEYGTLVFLKFKDGFEVILNPDDIKITE